MLTAWSSVNIYNIYRKLLTHVLIEYWNMNYPVIIAVLILVAALIIYLIKRNEKDKKDFEEEVLESETPTANEDKEKL